MGLALNSKGIILTFSVFLLAAAILLLTSTMNTSQLDFEERSELLALREANQKYRDVERNLMALDLSGTKKTVLEHGLPFSYSGTENSLSLSASFPVPSALPIYFSSINGYRIFFLKKALEDLSPEFALDINSAKDSNWGGSQTSANFLLLPFCAQLSTGPTFFSLGSSASVQCLTPFDSESLQRADFNVQIVDLREDFDSLQCNGLPCTAEPFNPANPNPFFSLSFSTASCPNCSFSPSLVSGHFPVGSDYNVFLSCTAPPCDSESIQFLFNEFFEISRSSAKSVRLEAQLEFDSGIQSFQSLDFNYAIRVPKYGIVRTNNSEPG